MVRYMGMTDEMHGYAGRMITASFITGVVMFALSLETGVILFPTLFLACIFYAEAIYNSCKLFKCVGEGRAKEGEVWNKKITNSEFIHCAGVVLGYELLSFSAFKSLQYGCKCEVVQMMVYSILVIGSLAAASISQYLLAAEVYKNDVCGVK